MRLALEPTPAFTHELRYAPASEPPLVFLDQEPFLVELQGALELSGESGDASTGMHGVKVGKIDFSQVVSYMMLAKRWSGVCAGRLTDRDWRAQAKPILRIAHHRLEGKLVTLTEPYAILKTTRDVDDDERASKRARLVLPARSSSPGGPVPSSSPVKPSGAPAVPKIEIVGVVRRKIVFSKRPEPMV